MKTKEILAKITPREIKKIIRKADNLRKYGLIDVFQNVTIETQTNCTRTCSYCPISKHPQEWNKMNFSLWKKIINELNEINFSGNLFPNGYNEPLVDINMLKMIKYARTKLPNAFLAIYTNADVLTMESFYKFIKIGLDEFVVSLHEPQNKFMETYDKMSDSEKKIIQFNITDKNRNSILDTRAGIVRTIGKQRIWNKCDVKALVIRADGSVPICCSDYFKEAVFGNVKNEKLINIWNKPKYKRIRENLWNGIADFDLCKRCMEIDVNNE